ncbi:MAG: DUF4290 domain-containing protein [Bacteroidales bacterium]|nr:DUF4290 domain-containing protein [Candidatus Colimorpha onthohippi]
MDYGRNVYKLVQYAKTIEDREQRNRIAEAIVGVMAQVNPHVRDCSDYRCKLWEHLMILAGGELDVDVPCDIYTSPSVRFHPKSVTYNNQKVMYRHYGKMLESMVRKVSEMPEGEERKVLEQQLAQNMKRSYINWNSEDVSDSVIVDQMEVLSGGKIAMQKDMKIDMPVLDDSQASDNTEKKSKRKRKKK